MKLSEFITAKSTQIISEWEAFARGCLPAAKGMDLAERRDHIAGMLRAVAVDLETPQSKDQQAEKSKGHDSHVTTHTAADSHGTDRAASGYSPEQMVAEFRALRASVLRLWSEAQSEFNRGNMQEMTRFNEAIDQLLAESIARFHHDVNSSKDVFLAVLGHDLRNPLGSIMMSATMMMRTEADDSPHSRTAARIVRSAARMDELIGDLVDLTRTGLGGGIPITRVEMDLEEVSRHVVDEIRTFHRDSTVKLETNGELHGSWDRGRVSQALSNLVGNAYQHGAAGAPIEVAVRGEPERVVLSVHNKGPRIPASQLGEIFNPFRQLDPAAGKRRESRSVGLGLHIAQSIVTAHGGAIDVDSTDDGTTFTMTLPR
jgi:signal transduction histidine kinase